MIVGVLLDTCVNQSVDHLGWFYCMMTDRHIYAQWEIIAQERYASWKVDGLGEKGTVQGAAGVWDYRVCPEAVRRAATPYIIPDEMLAQLEKERGGKYAAAVYLLEQRFTPLESLIESFLNRIEKERGPVDAIVTYPKAVKSLVAVAARRGIRLFAFEAGPLRGPVYQGTAFFCESASGPWMENFRFQIRFQAFQEAGTDCRCLTGKEILALLLQDAYLPCLRLYGVEKQWDMLVCGNWTLDEYSESKRTMRELLSAVREVCGDRFWFRPDPGDPFHADFGLPEERVDRGKPNVFSLARSRHVAANYGNILADALLWGAATHCLEPKWHLHDWCIPSIQDGVAAPPSDEALNFYFLSFLAPMELATTDCYVRWRLSDPDEPAIYRLHLGHHLARYGLDLSLLELPPEESLARILAARGAPAEYGAALTREEGESLEAFWKRAESLAPYQRPETTAERMSYAEMEVHNARLRTEAAEAESRDTRLQMEAMKAELHNAQAQTKAAEQALETVLHSRCWRMTGPLRKLLDWIKAWFRRN